MLHALSTHNNPDRPASVAAARAAHDVRAVASTIDLSDFAAAHRPVTAIPATCDHVGRGLHRRCDLASPNDITTWCFPCLRSHILDLREGNGDSFAGAFDGHAESMLVIHDALVDLAPFGPWGYSEDSDPEVCERIERYEPTAEDLAEVRGLLGDAAGRDHDGILSPEEEEIELFGMTDGEWAAEFLDPEEELAGMVAERELVRRVVEVGGDE